MSSFDTSLSFNVSTTVNSVSDQCEKSLNITLSVEVKQRIIHIVSLYRESLAGKTVPNYEVLVRAAAIVVLRQAGYVFRLAKLANRGTSGSSAVLRVVSKISSALGIELPRIGRDALLSRTLDIVLSNPKITGPNTDDIWCQDVLLKAIQISNAMIEHDKFPPIMQVTQSVALCYFVIRFETHSWLKQSFREFVRATGMFDSEKACYRDLELIQAFAREGLLLLGIRKFDGKQFIESLEPILNRLGEKRALQKRLETLAS